MASPIVFMEGFDKYGPPGVPNPRLNGEWTDYGVAGISVGVLSIAASLKRGDGGAIIISENANFGYVRLAKTFGASYSRLCGSVRVAPIYGGSQAASINAGFQFFNSVSVACSLTFNHVDGAIQFRTGTNAGTIIASGGLVPGDGTPVVVSFDITFGAAAAYVFYIDGVSVLSGTGNTGNGQTSVNSLRFFCYGSAGSGISLTIDDLVIFDPAQSGYDPAVLTDNLAIETQFPISDTQAQFTRDGIVLPPTGMPATGVYSLLDTIVATSANTMYLLRIIPPVNCTANSISVYARFANGAAKLRGVLYSDSAGSANTLLSSGTEVIGLSAGVVATCSLVTPQALTAGTAYWMGIFSDTALTLWSYDASDTSKSVSRATTYTGGAPAGPLTGLTTGGQTYSLWVNCTGATVSYPSINQNPPLGLPASQLHSNTPGQEDLYTFPSLSTVPNRIYACAVKGLVAKTDGGSRLISFNAKSGSTDATGDQPSQPLASLPIWQDSIFDTDPATGVAWTAAGINAAKYGFSIPAPTDPSFANVVLLCHFDGANGATSFTDSSSASHSVSATSGASLTTSQQKFGTASLTLAMFSPGAASANSTDWQFGAGQFTVEAWIRPTATITAQQSLIGLWEQFTDYSWMLGIDGSAIYLYYSTSGSGIASISGSYAAVVNSWVHVAADRDAGGTVRVYAGGVVLGSGVVGGLYNSTKSLVIGSDPTTTHTFIGQMDDVRITKGVARYAGAFTPPTDAFPNS